MELSQSPIKEPLELELPVDTASVTVARTSTGEFAERAGAAGGDVELAVAEAVANSVLHAYPDRAQGTINVRAELLGDDLVVSVADDGTGMRPNLERRGLGIGLAMIGRLTRELRIEVAPGGGALVTMRFAIGGAG
jgi:anti-sigma regulatory factor (Ser/Thr protein kinase)